MRENKVREHRQRLERTQKQLAERIGISRNHLTLIEIGRDNPSLEVAGRLASFLGVAIEEVFPWLRNQKSRKTPPASSTR